MQVLNLLQAARWKYRTQKCRQKSPSGHHRTTLSGYIFATKAHIDNWKKKLVKQQYVLHMSPQYGELRPTSGWDRLTSLGYPCKFQLVLHLGSVAARHLVVGISQTLRRWTEGASYIRQGDHHVGHWPTLLVLLVMLLLNGWHLISADTHEIKSDYWFPLFLFQWFSMPALLQVWIAADFLKVRNLSYLPTSGIKHWREALLM